MCFFSGGMTDSADLRRKSRSHAYALLYVILDMQFRRISQLKGISSRCITRAHIWNVAASLRFRRQMLLVDWRSQIQLALTSEDVESRA